MGKEGNTNVFDKPSAEPGLHKLCRSEKGCMNMKNFVLRVDAATMQALERWAGDEFRSINGQLQWIIAEALRRAGRTPERKSEQAHAAEK